MCRYYAVIVCNKLSHFNLTTVSCNRYKYHFTEKVKCLYILEEIKFSRILARKSKIKEKKKETA